ncbi:MAG: hypothetical protein KC912_02355 [Proteobacteria bacterium]|nr:hypothetical protein [Pseudomonadota bacterium]
MSDKRSTKELFRSWRGGDAESGSVMAQRFADWYYAISTSRLGEGDGAGPCQNACARFGEGIVNVTESRALIGWAHEIIKDEMAKSAKSRANDGDWPNAYTGGQSPKQLLVSAKGELANEVRLLELVYGGTTTGDEVEGLASPLGGIPIGTLTARYAVKRWLRNNARVPFDVAPDQPVLDRAPLPLYESGRMNSRQEEESFEQWMITDIDLCKDIAEFAHFAIALRGGLAGVSAGAGVGSGLNALPERPQVDFDDDEEGGSGTAAKAAGAGLALVAIGGLALLVVAAGAFFMLR